LNLTKAKYKRKVLSNAAERSDRCITQAQRTQFAFTNKALIYFKDNTLKLPSSCLMPKLEQITSTQDLNITQKLRGNFSTAAIEIWATTHSSTSNQPYTQRFSMPYSLRCWRRSKRCCRAFYAVLLILLCLAQASV
jgi:hypothetical protein